MDPTSTTEISSSTQFLFDEMRRMFAESDARWDERFASLQQRAPSYYNDDSCAVPVVVVTSTYIDAPNDAVQEVGISVFGSAASTDELSHDPEAARADAVDSVSSSVTARASILTGEAFEPGKGDDSNLIGNLRVGLAFAASQSSTPVLAFQIESSLTVRHREGHVSAPLRLHRLRRPRRRWRAPPRRQPRRVPPRPPWFHRPWRDPLRRRPRSPPPRPPQLRRPRRVPPRRRGRPLQLLVRGRRPQLRACARPRTRPPPGTPRGRLRRRLLRLLGKSDMRVMISSPPVRLHAFLFSPVDIPASESLRPASEKSDSIAPDAAFVSEISSTDGVALPITAVPALPTLVDAVVVALFIKGGEPSLQPNFHYSARLVRLGTVEYALRVVAVGAAGGGLLSALIQDVLPSHAKSSPLQLRVHGSVHVRTASVLDDHAAPARHHQAVLQVAQRAIELAPDSIEVAHCQAILLFVDAVPTPNISKEHTSPGACQVFEVLSLHAGISCDICFDLELRSHMSMGVNLYQLRPPPHVQATFGCGSADVRPIPWLSFTMGDCCWMRQAMCWKPPWPAPWQGIRVGIGATFWFFPVVAWFAHWMCFHFLWKPPRQLLALVIPAYSVQLKHDDGLTQFNYHSQSPESGIRCWGLLAEMRPMSSLVLLSIFGHSENMVLDGHVSLVGILDWCSPPDELRLMSCAAGPRPLISFYVVEHLPVSDTSRVWLLWLAKASSDATLLPVPCLGMQFNGFVMCTTLAIAICRYAHLPEWQRSKSMLWCWNIVPTDATHSFSSVAAWPELVSHVHYLYLACHIGQCNTWVPQAASHGATQWGYDNAVFYHRSTNGNIQDHQAGHSSILGHNDFTMNTYWDSTLLSILIYDCSYQWVFVDSPVTRENLLEMTRKNLKINTVVLVVAYFSEFVDDRIVKLEALDAAASEALGFEFGVNPELALAIQIFMEDQRARQVIIQFSWDPGGFEPLHRLGGKPNLKKGGMLGTTLGPSYVLWAWAWSSKCCKDQVDDCLQRGNIEQQEGHRIFRRSIFPSPTVPLPPLASSRSRALLCLVRFLLSPPKLLC